MSRIWKLPVSIPAWVSVKLEDDSLTVKWPLWVLNLIVKTDVLNIDVAEDFISVTPIDVDSKDGKIFWWTTRTNINNMILGVTEGFNKSLEINWVWYKMEVSWNKIKLNVWFSHDIELDAPESVKMVVDEKKKNIVHFSWYDKQILGQFVSKIRSYKKPEPYKGKWIKYVWEQIIRKAWKTGK